MTRKKQTVDAEFERLTEAVLEALDDKKAQDVLVIDVRGRCDYADRFVVATGRTDRQLKAMSQGLAEVAHKFGLPAKIEGLEAMEWLLVDLDDIVVHLFLAEVREAFQLDRLWAQPSSSTTAGAAED
ncbi:MAG TPA: ribosome silencing factor [Mariprofundaceae bacterium]|nr:ribosome silencing factor [Mariprofundaceae bacterium]